MRYIFNASGKCVASCDYEPNTEDLASRGEVAILSENEYQIDKVELVNGSIQEKAIIPPQPTQEEIIAGYTKQVQSYLDSTARLRNYDGILSLCSYATSTNPKFSKEGLAGVVWRDAVWAKCYSILADVKAEIRTAPTDLISELPPFSWGD